MLRSKKSFRNAQRVTLGSSEKQVSDLIAVSHLAPWNAGFNSHSPLIWSTRKTSEMLPLHLASHELCLKGWQERWPKGHWEGPLPPFSYLRWTLCSVGPEETVINHIETNEPAKALFRNVSKPYAGKTKKLSCSLPGHSSYNWSHGKSCVCLSLICAQEQWEVPGRGEAVTDKPTLSHRMVFLPLFWKMKPIYETVSC